MTDFIHSLLFSNQFQKNNIWWGVGGWNAVGTSASTSASASTAYEYEYYYFYLYGLRVLITARIWYLLFYPDSIIIIPTVLVLVMVQVDYEYEYEYEYYLTCTTVSGTPVR